MDFASLTPRTMGTIGVLALAPVLAYGLLRSNPFAGGVAAVNVLIIAYSLWQLTGPAEGDHGHGHGHGDGSNGGQAH